MSERTLTASTRRQKSAATASRAVRRPAGRASQGVGRRPAAKGAKTSKPSKTAAGPSRAGSLAERAKGVAASLGKARTPLVVAVVALIVLVTLYGPAQGLYAAWREQMLNQATLDGLTASIDEYQHDIDQLQTREGIEDEARKRGYVTEGESGVTAVGLPEEEDDEQPEQSLPWYLSLGDFVFQYHEEE